MYQRKKISGNWFKDKLINNWRLINKLSYLLVFVICLLQLFSYYWFEDPADKTKQKIFFIPFQYKLHECVNVNLSDTAFALLKVS